MMKTVLLVSLLAAVTMAAPSNMDLLKKLLAVLEEKELEDKNVMSTLMGATSDSLTVQLGQNLEWSRQGSWTMSVRYWQDGQDESTAETVDPGFQTWGAWGKMKCEIPGYPGKFQPQCVTIPGLKSDTKYTVQTVIKFKKGPNDITENLIYGTSQTFSTLASKKSEDLDVKLLKALKDLLDE